MLSAQDKRSDDGWEFVWVSRNAGDISCFLRNREKKYQHHDNFNQLLHVCISHVFFEEVEQDFSRLD